MTEQARRVAGPLDARVLDRLFRPRRLALVGASDKNLFSRRAFAQSRRLPAARPVVLVNPNSPVVHETTTVGSCTDVDGGIDCAYLLTPARVTPDALRDAAAGGARAAVVVSQGWAEEGPAGVARQQELVALAEQLGVVLLGPNHLGFANLWDGVAACGMTLEMPIEPGPFALVSQSGAVASSMVAYAARHDVRFSFVVTTGNEAMVTVADVLDYVLDDENTRAVGVFAETIRRPAVFRAALEKAARLGKAVVVLKAGSSELAARTAQAHTGALVGDDRVVDAVLRQCGAVRVRTVEDLIGAGNLAATVGVLRAPGVAVLSVSGGACDLVADRGDDEGLPLPQFSDATNAALAELLPSYGHPQNPLDVTGGALANPEVWRRGIEAVAAEPGIGLVGIVTSLPTPGEPQREATFHAVAQASASTGLPAVVFPQVDQEPSAYVREVKAASGVRSVLPGVERFVVAASKLSRWSRWQHAHAAAEAQLDKPETLTVALPAFPLSEFGARGLLATAGVPTVPATLVTSRTAATDAAVGYGGPVALKMCSAQVAHKTELGGVVLGVTGADAVGNGYDTLVDRAHGAGIVLDGVLVSPMRTGGLELLVGVVTDPDWGKVLAVGFGGALVELLDDTALRVLPVGPADVRAMLDELHGRRLLDGYRGSKPVDVDALVDVVLRVARLADALGPQVSAVEVNPLLVDGDRIEALDVLVTAADPS